MEGTRKVTRILGAAFLLQFITSFGNGVFIGGQLFVEDNIAATLQNIGSRPGLMQANIMLDMLTALGVIFLGAMLYLTLRNYNEKMALTGFVFYILEGAVLAASKGEAFKLLLLSREYTLEASANLEMMAAHAYETMNFVGSVLHMAAFCAGGVLFYLLLDKARIVPRWLSLWGLVTIIPLAIGSVLNFFGLSLPFALYVPYVPFELVIGIWVLVKGVPEEVKAG